MASSVCISCGVSKSRTWEKCSVCGFDPRGDEIAMAKSVYLSVGRYEEEVDRTRYANELDAIGQTIRDGVIIEYDQAELERLLAQKKAFDRIPMTSVWSAVFRFFLPGFLFIGTLFFLFLLIRWLK